MVKFKDSDDLNISRRLSVADLKSSEMINFMMNILFMELIMWTFHSTFSITDYVIDNAVC